MRRHASRLLLSAAAIMGASSAIIGCSPAADSPSADAAADCRVPSGAPITGCTENAIAFVFADESARPENWPDDAPSSLELKARGDNTVLVFRTACNTISVEGEFSNDSFSPEVLDTTLMSCSDAQTAPENVLRELFSDRVNWSTSDEGIRFSNGEVAIEVATSPSL